MPKCEKCGSDLGKPGNQYRTNRHYTSLGGILVGIIYCSSEKCDWASYVDIPNYIPEEQFERYLNAKV